MKILIIGLLSMCMMSLLAADCGSCGGTCPVPEKKDVQVKLNTEQMIEVVNSGKVLILDARYGKYDDGKRIPGAKSLNEKSTVEEVKAIVSDKDAQIVTYCAGLKCPASEHLAKHLKELGYKNVREYPEGIEGWIAAGKKTEEAVKAK